VARALLDAGHDVQVLIRDRERAASLVGCGAEIVEGDMAQDGPWAKAMERSDAVIHTAAHVAQWSTDPEPFERVNVRATLNLVDRAHAAGVSRILVTSSLFVFGSSGPETLIDEHRVGSPPPPLTQVNDYVRTKTAAATSLWERQRCGHGVIILYPTILLGPGRLTEGNHTSLVISDIGKKRLPGLVGSGEQIWNLVPVEHAARGFVQTLERGRPGENYILGGENWTQRRLVESAARHFGVKPPVRRLGRRLPMSLAWLAERWAGLSGHTPFLTRAAIRLYDADWAFSSEKAKRELAYEPGDVEATVLATVAWLRDEVWTRDPNP
jgi:dihydroflavonol-4-reductase